MHLLATCLLALASHVAFCNYEPTLIFVAGMYALGSLAYVALNPAASLADSLVDLLAALFIYNSTLLFSIAVYRLFFHRLRHFPGPTLMILTCWAAVIDNAKGRHCFVIDKLHKKYGNIVRVGPRIVSINDVKAISAVLGANSNLHKAPSYRVQQAGREKGTHSVLTTSPPSDHRIRRGPWDAAFNINALKSYETALREINEKFLGCLDSFAADEQVTDIGKWAQFMTFDVMSELGFSRCLDLIGKGDFSRPVQLLQGAMAVIMGLGVIPYVADVLQWLPNPLTEMEAFAEGALKERFKEEAQASASRDIISHLIDPEASKAWKLTWHELISDASVIIVAGSDTSSSVMAMAVYCLMGRPDILQQLREEIDAVFGDEDADDYGRLGKECKMLDAVINETMRVYPPGASGVGRVTPPQGLTVPTDDGPVYIPGNVIVSIPPLTLHHDPRYYSPHPDAFRPERWLHPEKEEYFNKDAFIPFGYGPYGCVGKALAYMEMRLFIARLVQRYDFTPAPGFDYDNYPLCIRDNLTMARTLPLNVVLKRRAKAA